MPEAIAPSLDTPTADFVAALTTFVPERSIWAMMLVGLAALGFAAYRRGHWTNIEQAVAKSVPALSRRMSAKHLILGMAMALIAWPAPVQAQAGRPVTAGDLSGKTVCWEDGWRITYAKDGSYFGSRGDSPAVNHHNARWSISEPGVVQIDQPGKPRSLQIVVLPDGRYERDRFQAKNKKGMAGINRNFGTLCH